MLTLSGEKGNISVYVLSYGCYAAVSKILGLVLGYFVCKAIYTTCHSFVELHPYIKNYLRSGGHM